MNERERIRTPRDLQEQIKIAYSVFPVKIPDVFLIDYHKAKARRMGREAYSLILGKFIGLVRESPTTESFKETMGLLADKLMVDGRLNEKDHEHIQSYGEIMVKVLALNTPEGIYSKEGARVGEKTLREFVLKEFINQINADEETGQDVMESEFWIAPFFDDFLDGKEFLLKWRQEFKDLYGEAPSQAMPESMEDLIFRGPK